MYVPTLCKIILVLDKDISGNVNTASTCINYAEEPIPEQCMSKCLNI